MTLHHNQQQPPMPDDLAPARSRISSSYRWKAYIFLGILLFIFFYLMIPAWLNQELHLLQNNAIRPIAEPLLIRRIDWVQRLGIVLASVCNLLAIHHYIATRPIIGNDTHFLSRLLAKLMG